MIELRGVTVDVDGPQGPLRLLDSVSVSLAERRVGVIGDNGSGKSTLLRLIDGLVAPTGGQVLVGGADTVADGKTVRRMVGFVFTDAMAQLLAPTAVEDVELSLRSRVRDKRQRTAQALELLDRWQLAHLARRSVYDLSGGERQLVALTSVLAVEPLIVLADEPTTLLDLTNRMRLRAAFRQLGQQLVVATHDLDLAADMDRVLVMWHGRIAFDGPAADGIAWYRERTAAAVRAVAVTGEQGFKRGEATEAPGRSGGDATAARGRQPAHGESSGESHGGR